MICPECVTPAVYDVDCWMCARVGCHAANGPNRPTRRT